MCDSIYDAIDMKYGNHNDFKLDKQIFEKIVEERTLGINTCTKEYVDEVIKTRFTFPYRFINPKVFPFPRQTELLYAYHHYNITDENINTGFAEQYPYIIFDSLMYNAIIKKYGDNIFKTINYSSDSLDKIGKGYKDVKLLGRVKLNSKLKDIFKGIDINKIECSRMNILSLTIDSNGKCSNISVVKLGWHGRTMPSSCTELIKIVDERKLKFAELKWKPAEFEGRPISRTLSISFHEFKND